MHVRDPNSDSWQVISHMATPRCHCFAAVLNNNQVMVVRGYTDASIPSETDSVELATVK